MKYILILIQLLIFVGESHSDDFYDKKVSKVDLVPKESVFKIKNEYYFGIKFKMNEGWKTYWKNPGDAGLPVDIKFLGDKNQIKAEILFPSSSYLAVSPVTKYLDEYFDQYVSTYLFVCLVILTHI